MIKSNQLLKVLCLIQLVSIVFFMEILNEKNIYILSWTILNCAIILFLIPKIKIPTSILLFCIFQVFLIFFHILRGMVSINQYYGSILIYSNLFISIILWFIYLRLGISIVSIFSCLTCLGTFLSVLVIIECLLKDNVFFGRFTRRESTLSSRGIYLAQGSMGNHIVLSMFICLLIIISIYLFMYVNRLYLFPIIVQFISLLFCGSRTGYIAFGCCILFFLIKFFISLFYKRNFLKLLCCLALLTILSLLIYLLIDQIPLFDFVTNRFSSLSGSENASARHRINAILMVLFYFLDQNPFFWFFGNGFGSLMYRLSTRQESYSVMSGFYVVDNQFVSYLYDMGILSFVCVLCLFFKMFFSSLTYSESPIMKTISYCSIVLFIFFFSFDAFTWLASVSLIGFIVGLYFYEKNMITQNIEK